MMMPSCLTSSSLSQNLSREISFFSTTSLLPLNLHLQMTNSSSRGRMRSTATRDFATASSQSSSSSSRVFATAARDSNINGSESDPIPIYVMLPLGIITWNDEDNKSELVDKITLEYQLSELKRCGVDGVMVDCWWGLVERTSAKDYHWEGYTQLFELVKQNGLKLQVVMSFHSCGGNVGDDVNIPLPSWVREIRDKKKNPNIFFIDEQGRVNEECLSWGIDEVYSDYMYSFRMEFSTYFEDRTISEIEVGLGPCGELRYPSYPEIHGWRYPGIGQFQCYDAYLKASIFFAANALGKSHWGIAPAPQDLGEYNSTPQATKFFCEGGEYDSYHGRFFLSWYAEILVRHGDRVLSAAKCIFEGTPIAAKLAGVHWCYKSTSHAAELTAGFYNRANRDGYTAIIAMLKKNGAALNFTCVELRTEDEQRSSPEAMTDPERLVWQVLNDGWDLGLKVAAENALPCYTREGYKKILASARPFDSPDGRHLCAFTYLRLSHTLFERHNLLEFERFVAGLHNAAMEIEE